MRIPVVTVGIAAVVALLAGCSSMSQERHDLPSTMAAQPLLRIGAAPLKEPEPAARAAFNAQLEHAGHNAKAVRLWVVNFAFSYLLGLDESGTKIVDTIDLRLNGCNNPGSVKVDGSQNVWIGCQGEPSKGYADGSSEQEYSSSGVLRRSYTWTAPCPPSASVCAANGTGDGGPDNHGHVFATLGAAAILVRGVQQNLDSGFYWWPAGKPQATPTFISLGTWCQPICETQFMDTDSLGNIWFTYIGMRGGLQGSGLAEIGSPTTKPYLVAIFRPDPFDALAGVVISDGGKTLNLVDATKHEIYQYALPMTPASKPFRTLGPTATALGSLGYPVTGGFNKTETKLAIGDVFGWIDVGTMASNRWKAVLNLHFLTADYAAAYTPSDK